MSGEDEKHSLKEAHLPLAKKLNGHVWELLDRQTRSPREDDLMVHAAHASCYHWLQAGTGVHHQRGEWMIARVYTVLGIPQPALHHAGQCLDLTEEFPELMEDFDHAFAWECAARANAAAGNTEEAIRYIGLAEAAGRDIADEEDRKIFIDEFNAGDWYGVR